MKNVLITVMIFILFVPPAMGATYVYYRTSSGEVELISDVQELSVPQLIFSEAVDPTFVDGMDINSPDGEPDVLGYAKVFDNGTVRNATQQEIDGFAAARADDKNIVDADKAKNYLANNPQLRMIMKAFAKLLIDEFNILRSQHGLSDREFDQLWLSLKNRINKDD
jgi:hypothetical protein